MKIAFGFGVLLLVVGMVYAYTHQRVGNVSQVTFVSQDAQQAKVTGVDPSKLQIYISGTPVGKTIQVDSSTRIIKVLVQRSASGAVERTVDVEINLSDVQNGDEVQVSYQTLKDNVLTGVSDVTLNENTNIDAYYKQKNELQKTAPNAYLKGQVVSLDLAAKKIVYKPFMITSFATTTISTSFTNSTPVDWVDDPTRVDIIHARMPAALAAIKPGMIIFLMVDNKALQAGKIVPQAFIISGI